MLEQFAFVSPFLYAALLTTAWGLRAMGIVKPFDPSYHNYNMIAQSCLLLGITSYQYYATMARCQLRWTDFVAISHEHALWNQQTLQTSVWTKCVLLTFLTSKVFEWFDTVALIVNRKRVVALHVWHHATIGVAFYTGYFCSSVLWIAGLNSFIHVVMYAYYANIPGVRRVARYLTQLQIFQLFGGVYMNYRSYIREAHPVYKKYALLNGAICLSYGLMFLQFYGRKYKSKRASN